MNKFVVEYLIIIKRCEICNSTDSLKNLLRANAKIKFDGNCIKYKSIPFEFTLVKKFEENKFRYFHLTINLHDEDNLDNFTKLLRAIRTLIIQNEGKIEVLNDDISFYYSQKAYPLLNRIENLMRKLITLFLIDSNGFNWGKNAIPIDIENPKSNNFLNRTDFIQLGEILTKEYPINEVNNLLKTINNANSINDLDFNYLKTFVLKSNLDRYFKPYINFNADYLKKKWKRLYELRCLVAHNNFFHKHDFNELQNLIGEVKEKLENAISNIDKVNIPEEEKDIILEFTLSNSSELLGQFIASWNELERKIFIFNKCTNKRAPFFKNIQEIYQDGYLTETLFNELKILNNRRNALVHHLPEIELNEKDIELNIKSIKRIIEQFVIEKDFGKSWPLSVDRGVIFNIKNAVIFRYKNKEYGLNGVASHAGYTDIDEIWKDNKEIPGTKIPIGILINIGTGIVK